MLQTLPFARMLSLDPTCMMPAANDGPTSKGKAEQLSPEQGQQFALQSGFFCMANHRIIFEMPQHLCDPQIN